MPHKPEDSDSRFQKIEHKDNVIKHKENTLELEDDHPEFDKDKFERDFKKYSLQERHRQEMYKQSTLAASDFLSKTLICLFFMNAATAIILLIRDGGEKTSFIAMIFAAGAGLAIMAFMFAYNYSLLLVSKWGMRHYMTKSDAVLPESTKLSKALKLVFLTALFSLFVFFAGAFLYITA